VYNFNDTLDRKIFEPVARGYAKVTPEFARTGVTNFFGNLNYLNVIFNDLLQAKAKQFANDSGRFVVNSTAGIGGFFDPATKIGLQENDEDLGQTFGTWGAGEGAYLVVPFLGPNSFRDLPDAATSTFLNPMFYFHAIDAVVTVPLGALNAINKRANLLEATSIRDQAALDPYTFVREAYRQQRTYKIYDGNPPGEGFDDYVEDKADKAILKIY
jgi:phospholipid-binding lipoprotein MlaA